VLLLLRVLLLFFGYGYSKRSPKSSKRSPKSSAMPVQAAASAGLHFGKAARIAAKAERCLCKPLCVLLLGELWLCHGCVSRVEDAAAAVLVVLYLLLLCLLLLYLLLRWFLALFYCFTVLL
jgi:hypothetical protein